jgi:hypothetical protein
MRAGLIALLAAGLLQSVHSPDAGQLVSRAAQYVTDYQQQLTSIVADETYTQHVRAQVPRDKGMKPTRTTVSEVFFLYVPGSDWMAMRDVARMDGHAVPDRFDLMGALRSLPAGQVARSVKAYNSRFNLGNVLRNFNEPTLSLLVLDPRHRERFQFDFRRFERMGTSQVAIVGFRETAAPTLIYALDGQPVFSAGEFAIEPETGRVRRARLALKIGTVEVNFLTTYEPDSRLGILVPRQFRESYEDGKKVSARNSTDFVTARYEEIFCEAKYSNFRRFEVKAIIR